MSTEAIRTNATQHAGHTVTLEWFYDEFMGPPWEEHDGHGTVSDWTTRDKAPSERVLAIDRNSRRYYDQAASMKTALADGWGLSDGEAAKLAALLGRKPTRREIAARAVELDFKHLKSWCNSGWHWVGYSLTVTDSAGREVKSDSLWGIDSLSMADFEAEAMTDAREWIDKETTAALDAACRDIATV